jgi:hypothetical protein
MVRVQEQPRLRPQPRSNAEHGGPIVGGWGDGKLAHKGVLMAGYDVAAELEAALGCADGPRQSEDRDTGVYMIADDDLIVADVEESDFELHGGGKLLDQELQAQLHAFESQNATDSDDEFVL